VSIVKLYERTHNAVAKVKQYYKQQEMKKHHREHHRTTPQPAHGSKAIVTNRRNAATDLQSNPQPSLFARKMALVHPELATGEDYNNSSKEEPQSHYLPPQYMLKSDDNFSRMLERKRAKAATNKPRVEQVVAQRSPHAAVDIRNTAGVGEERADVLESEKESAYDVRRFNYLLLGGPTNQETIRESPPSSISSDERETGSSSRSSDDIESRSSVEEVVTPASVKQQWYWNKNKSFVPCSALVAVLLVIIMALSITIGVHKCRDAQSSGDAEVMQQLESIVNVSATARSITPDTTRCLLVTFLQPLFPSDCVACSFRMANDINQAIVSSSADHSIHFFSFSNNTWKEDASFVMDSGNFDMPVAISKNKAVVGTPYETKLTNSGRAYVFEKSEDNWAEATDHLTKGWENNDYEVEAGIIQNFGRSVAVDNDLIAVGAFADLGRINPTFVFRRLVYGGFSRETISPIYSDRYRMVNAVDIRNDIAVSSLSSPQVPTDKDGTVFVYKIQQSGATLVQKLSNVDCKLFGRKVAILNGGGLVVSCTFEDGTSALQYYNTSNGGKKYALEQEIANAGRHSTTDWFDVDDASNTLAVLKSSFGETNNATTVVLYVLENGLWMKAITVTTPSQEHCRSVALAKNTLLMDTGRNIHAYSIEHC